MRRNETDIDGLGIDARRLYGRRLAVRKRSGINETARSGKLKIGPIKNVRSAHTTTNAAVVKATSDSSRNASNSGSEINAVHQ